MSIELPWDPEIESPATIAILGGGPVGIEAALYGRFLGYFVSIFESRRVGHRMLDWHERPLALPVRDLTTSLGHAAIAAQDPGYCRPDPDRIFTGREYAEEYLLPLAKTDLLFDDIHFLSPVVDIARVRTFRSDPVDLQDRCNDEFRIVVQGRHRGPWTARADCILDCRGTAVEEIGLGPGGGVAIGEKEHEASFLLHAPGDRKFDKKSVDGKRLVLVGQSDRACRCVSEWLPHVAAETVTRLTWVVRPRGTHDTEAFLRTWEALQNDTPRNVVLIEALGVDAITPLESGSVRLCLLKDDDTTVELETDLVMRRTGYRYRSIAPELNESPSGPVRLASASAGEGPEFVTAEPGYYALDSNSMQDEAGAGLPRALEQIRQVYALMGGRADLDLYSIMDRQ